MKELTLEEQIKKGYSRLSPESRIELQKLDCNCNDCIHLIRDFVKKQQSVDLHYRWGKDAFDISRIKTLKAAKRRSDKGEHDKAKELIKEARKMVFQFDDSGCSTSFGYCAKFKKDVKFIPNILLLYTQECFEHRKG